MWADRGSRLGARHSHDAHAVYFVLFGGLRLRPLELRPLPTAIGDPPAPTRLPRPSTPPR